MAGPAAEATALLAALEAERNAAALAAIEEADRLAALNPAIPDEPA